MNTTINTGALELRMLYQRYMTESLIVAGMIHFLLVGGVKMYIQLSGTPDEKRIIRITKDVVLNPPPSISNTTVPQVAVASAVKPSVGTPYPIPDAEINPEATIATQEQMNQPTVGSEIGNPNGTEYVIEPSTIAEESAPPAFVPVEKLPIPISHPSPIYPEIARRAGVEGTVHINMWVTKEGKVKQAVVLKSTADILNQAAIDVALQWTFTPAIMNNGPVAVWVSVPFKFRLSAK